MIEQNDIVQNDIVQNVMDQNDMDQNDIEQKCTKFLTVNKKVDHVMKLLKF